VFFPSLLSIVAIGQRNDIDHLFVYIPLSLLFRVLAKTRFHSLVFAQARKISTLLLFYKDALEDADNSTISVLEIEKLDCGAGLIHDKFDSRAFLLENCHSCLRQIASEPTKESECAEQTS
jgi:hypothetical protein